MGLKENGAGAGGAVVALVLGALFVVSGVALAADPVQTVDLATPFSGMVNTLLSYIMQVLPYALGAMGIVLGVVCLIALMKLIFRKL